MVIIAGLGNPGEEYDDTRHNIGYKIVLALCEKLGVNFMRDAQQYRANKLLRTKVGEEKVAICLPMGYMNNSGTILNQILEFFGDNTSKDLWVIHDDTEIKFGQFRIKYGGTSGGHNGIKSIDETIGNHYWRIRVGVGRPTNDKNADLSEYVLNRFTKDEEKALPGIIDQVTTHLLKSLQEAKLGAVTINTNAKKD